VTLGLFGGAFDPPHRGHVELARRAKEIFGLDRLVVLVSTRPGHKEVSTPASTRLALARAAFPADEVVLDDQARTVETLEAHPEWVDPLFLIGADEFCDFLSWTRPNDVLERARLGVATRPGFPRARLQSVLERLRRPERVAFFEIEPTPVASRDLRARLEAGEDVSDAVPSAVADMIGTRMLYRDDRGVH
jgi:nicotinate-nucleotide adenylyltransferase